MSRTSHVLLAWILVGSASLAKDPPSTPMQPDAASKTEEARDSSSADRSTPPQKVIDASLLAGSDFASLLADQVPSAYDRLLATITVEDKAAQVSWAPFLDRREYHELLSETRVQMGQKDGKTNLGVVLRWNPLAPRGRRGMRVWSKMDVPYFGDEYAELREERRQRLRLLDTILAEISPQIEELSRRAQDLDRQSQYFDLSEDQRSTVKEQLAATKKKLDLERARAHAVLHSRILSRMREMQGCVDRTASREQCERVRSGIYELLRWASLNDPSLATIEARIEEIDRAMAKVGAGAVAAFERGLFSRPLPVISLSYQASLFPAIGGSFVDSDGDGLDDHAHTLAARSIVLSALMRIGPANQLSLASGRSWTRASAKEGAGLGRANNYALTYARRVHVLDPNYEQSEDYLRTLFVPSVVGGISTELSECRSELANCQSRAGRMIAITPFVDLKLKRSAQFRLGVTWKHFSDSAIAGEELAVISLIGLQLGLPN